MYGDRKKLVLLVATVLLCGQVCLSAPKTFNGDFRQAVGQVQRRQYATALKLFDAMLGAYKDPSQVSAIRQQKAACLLTAGKHELALAEIATWRGALPKDKDVQVKAQMLKGDALRGWKKFDEAIAAYRQLDKDYPDYSDSAAEALLRAGDVYCNDLKKAKEGVAVYAEVERKFAAQIPRAAEAARRTAIVQETLAKDLPKAAVAYRSLAEKYAAAYDERTRAGFYTKAVGCLEAAGKLPEALAVAAAAEKGLQTTVHKTPFGLKQVDLLLATGKTADARAHCCRIICTYPLEQNLCQAAQVRVVTAYRAESKFAEALGAARILYDAAGSDARIKAAAHVVAQAFRSVDGNLGRANEFLLYQRFGPAGADGKPNTADDVKANHLATAAYPPAEPVREKQFAAAVAAQPKTYQGYRGKAFLHAYWGKPAEAARQFRMALKSCSDAEIAQAASELVLIGMKALRASCHGLDKVFEYISYGPRGRDGKQNIPDPFKALASR